jgi:hypothetical protein
VRSLGTDHPYVSLLQSAPGIACTLGFTIASKIGEHLTLLLVKEADGLHRTLPFMNRRV